MCLGSVFLQCCEKCISVALSHTAVAVWCDSLHKLGQTISSTKLPGFVTMTTATGWKLGRSGYRSSLVKVKQATTQSQYGSVCKIT